MLVSLKLSFAVGSEAEQNPSVDEGLSRTFYASLAMIGPLHTCVTLEAYSPRLSRHSGPVQNVEH